MALLQAVFKLLHGLKYNVPARQNSIFRVFQMFSIRKITFFFVCVSMRTEIIAACEKHLMWNSSLKHSRVLLKKETFLTVLLLLFKKPSDSEASLWERFSLPSLLFFLTNTSLGVALPCGTHGQCLGSNKGFWCSVVLRRGAEVWWRRFYLTKTCSSEMQ